MPEVQSRSCSFNFLMKLVCSTAIVVLVCCFVLPGAAEAAVFRDRAAFNAASQNLNTIDFDSVPNFEGGLVIDGLVFGSIGGMSMTNGQNGNRLLSVQTVGEITQLRVHLPPGTTAVACDQFMRPMIISIATGESVTMTESDSSNFVGFVTDQPIQTLVVSFDFPEPTPNALVDNISYGQRRVGSEPPIPQLLATTQTGRALALDSVTTENEPFNVLSSHNLSTDGHARITLFLVGVALQSSDVPFIVVQAEDAQQRLFDLPVEAAARVKNLTWMSQVTVRLPDSIAGAGNVNVSVNIRGKVSNKAPLQIE
jgi:hypothetical protein